MKTTSRLIEALLNLDLKTAAETLTAGADINAKYEPDGWTALHYMVEKGNSAAVAWLIDKGADINARNSFGWTPLHLAIDAEADSARQEYNVKGVLALSGDLTKLLLERGTDPNIATNNGKTPLALARAAGHSAAVEALRKHGASDA